jgi:hypothetical protein
MTKCLSRSQDDDSMMIVCVEEHRISGVVGACVRVVFKRACVSRHLMAIAWRIIDDDFHCKLSEIS